MNIIKIVGVEEDLNDFQVKYKKRVVPSVPVQLLRQGQSTLELWGIDVYDSWGDVIREKAYKTEYGFYNFPSNKDVTKYQKMAGNSWNACDLVDKKNIHTHLVRVWLPYIYTPMDNNYDYIIKLDADTGRLYATFRIGAKYVETELQRVTFKSKDKNYNLSEEIYVFLPEQGMDGELFHRLYTNICKSMDRDEARKHGMERIMDDIDRIHYEGGMDYVYVEVEDVVVNTYNIKDNILTHVKVD